MKVSGVDSITFWIISSVTAFSSVFIGPMLDGVGLSERLIATALAIPSLFFLFTFIRSRLLRIKCRRLLGEWLYTTYSFSVCEKYRGKTLASIPDEDVGFARMEFYFNDDGGLSYRVSLFDSLEELKASSDSGVRPGVSKGVAISDAITYDDSADLVRVYYTVEYHDVEEPTRSGRLTMNLNGACSLSGNWSSDINKTSLSSGRLIGARPEFFEEVLANFVVR